MKAFLMYRDRDFDVRQLLSRRDKELRYRNADQKALDLRQLLPWNEAALTQDLGLDVLHTVMADGDQFLFEAAKVAICSSVTDLDTILYRQRVYSDCSKHPQVVRDMYRIAMEAIEGERKSYLGGYLMTYPSTILHREIEVLQIFVGLLRRLRAVVDKYAGQFQSDGFSRLFAMLQEELSDAYFDRVEHHLKQLAFRHGAMISAELGKGNKGKDYDLRTPNEDKRNWLAKLVADKPGTYTFHLHPRDEAGARALSHLNDRGVNLVANATAQSVDHILSFFQMLRTELAFYIGCLNLREKLAQIGEPTCLPIPSPADRRQISFAGLYDVSLALSMGKKVVGNDVDADNKSLFIITGANTGGKSTFLRSVGLAQLMMQAGMFVPAESFDAEVCEGVFTHYKREEDVAMESGKWDEELSRMSEIVDKLKPNALMLFNESFASTNEREGSEIAGQIVRALQEKRVTVFYVTHLYHLAQSVFSQHLDSAMFLRAERRPDGTRPFKLIEGEPLQTSYGEDLHNVIFGDREEAAAIPEPDDRHELANYDGSAQ
jgi:DNA mismatch repair ATPase MutS